MGINKKRKFQLSIVNACLGRIRVRDNVLPMLMVGIASVVLRRSQQRVILAHTCQTLLNTLLPLPENQVKRVLLDLKLQGIGITSCVNLHLLCIPQHSHFPWRPGRGQRRPMRRQRGHQQWRLQHSPQRIYHLHLEVQRKIRYKSRNATKLSGYFCLLVGQKRDVLEIYFCLLVDIQIVCRIQKAK